MLPGMRNAFEIDVDIRRQFQERGADWAVAALADRQHRVVGRRQLIAVGLTESGIRARLERGRLHALHRGVYAVGHRLVGREGRWVAAVMSGGESAVLSHRSA